MLTATQRPQADASTRQHKILISGKLDVPVFIPYNQQWPDVS